MTPTATATAPTKKTYKVMYEDWEMTVEVDPTDDTITSMDEALAASGQTWMIATSQGVVNEFLKRLAKSILVYSVQYPEARDFDGYLKTWSPWCSVRGVRIVSVDPWKFDNDGFEILEVTPEAAHPQTAEKIPGYGIFTVQKRQALDWLRNRFDVAPVTRVAPFNFFEVSFSEAPQLVPIVATLKEIEEEFIGQMRILQTDPWGGLKGAPPRVTIQISELLLKLIHDEGFMTQEDGHED